MNLKLNDSVIAHIAKLLQLAIITGTDIVDHMRMIRLRIAEEENETKNILFLSEEYEKNANSNIEKMINEIPDKHIDE